MRRLLMCGLTTLAFMLNGGQMAAQSKVFEEDPLFENLKEGEKGAILLTHFGTTHDDTRAVTLDAINQLVAKEYPQLEVREAYTSRIIIKRLADKKGIKKLNPTEALEQLHKEGYTHVLVVPTPLTDGLEMTSVWREVQSLEPMFTRIRVATPILFHEADYLQLLKVLVADSTPEVATIWVGHGTYDVATAQYAMLDHLLMLTNHPNVIIGCVEGYPYFEQAQQRLKATGLKKVLLRPLMMVAGEHAKEDMAGEWLGQLQEMGYEVQIRLEGLAELPEMKQLILDKINFFMHNRRLSIGEKKKIYEVTGEKLHENV